MPLKELQRLQAVNRFLTLEIDRTHELEAIVKLAAEICQTPTALITILDDQTQYIQFQVGFDRPTTPKTDAFCQYTIQQEALLEVYDATQDERFVNNPLVQGEPHIRFYAGSPLTTQDGHRIGSLCVLDQRPKRLTGTQKQLLQILAQQVIQILEVEFSIKALKELYVQTKQAELKLRAFFDSSTSCHLLLGKHCEVLAYNKASQQFIEQVFGVQIQEGADIRPYVHAGHLSTFLTHYQIALGGQASSSERELIYGNNAVNWSITYAPTYNEAGAIMGVSYNATDVTNRITQERLVDSQNQSLRKIAFIQSHEIRRPVSSIIGLLALIKEESYYDPQREELVMLEQAVEELDEKIKAIVAHTVPPSV